MNRGGKIVDSQARTATELTYPRPRWRKRYDRTNDAHCLESRDADGNAVLLPPINFIFKLLQSRATISVWLYENLGLRIEGKLRVRADNLQDVSHCMLISNRVLTSS
jgi:small nuclear ribonucleoprotein E